MKQYNIGVMQGRLVPDENGKIQSFPTTTWPLEFPILHTLGISLVEWTIDESTFDANPLTSLSNYSKVKNLCKSYNVSIPSVTCDFVMQNKPFDFGYTELRKTADRIATLAKNAHHYDIKYLVLPFVDDSSPKSLNQLIDFCNLICKTVSRTSFTGRLLMELDLPPDQVKTLLANLPDLFGINYDTGNSAYKGYDSELELAEYGESIFNIHIKDRTFGGPTCPLGEGNFNFQNLRNWIQTSKYSENLILQCSRPPLSGSEVFTILSCLAFINKNFRD